MSDLTKIELHDALIRGLYVDYRGKTVTVDIDLYRSQGERNRLPGAIEFKGVTSISLIGDLERLAQHASAGNVNYWVPSVARGTTYIYLVDGCIAIDADVVNISGL